MNQTDKNYKSNKKNASWVGTLRGVGLTGSSEEAENPLSRKKKKNRRNGGTGGDNEMTAMVHSFKSVSLSWHDARSVDLRMWRMQR